ncbi:hypothetical protein [Streptomyces sp. NPDC002851]
MTSPYAHGPAPTATLIRTGRNNIKQGVVGSASCAFVSFFFIAVGLMAAAGVTGQEPKPGGFGGAAVGLLGLWFAFSLAQNTWRARRSFICVDHVGIWISNPAGNKVVPWATLAGVGVYWSKGTGRAGGGTLQYSIELCPNGPIDRDHPVLWNLVRDEDPIHPSLPRLRYRLPANGADRAPLIAAVQQYAAHLWLGESERAPGHIGFPDVKGHRARTRGRR